MLGVILLSLIFISCGGNPVQDLSSVSTRGGKTYAGSSSSTQQKLQAYLRQHPQSTELVRDAILLVDAELLAERGDLTTALVLLRKSFKLASGRMQRHVFVRYLTMLADSQDNPRSLDFFVQQVRLQLNYSGSEVTELIAKHLSGRLVVETTNLPLPPNLVEALRKDPTLEKNAHRYCRRTDATEKMAGVGSDLSCGCQNLLAGGLPLPV